MRIEGDRSLSLAGFLVKHNKAQDNLRIGQRFVNIYIDNPWPELFYEEDYKKAVEMIAGWLTDHQYFEIMPPTSKRYRKALYLERIGGTNEA